MCTYLPGCLKQKPKKSIWFTLALPAFLGWVIVNLAAILCCYCPAERATDPVEWSKTVKKILVLLSLSQPDALLISDQETFLRKFFTRARFNWSLLYVALDRELLSKENNFKRLSKAWQPWSLSCNNWNIRESLRHTLFRVRSTKAFKYANLKLFVNLIIK